MIYTPLPPQSGSFCDKDKSNTNLTENQIQFPAAPGRSGRFIVMSQVRSEGVSLFFIDKTIDVLYYRFYLLIPTLRTNKFFEKERDRNA
jgi:hypothetical protein